MTKPPRPLVSPKMPSPTRIDFLPIGIPEFAIACHRVSRLTRSNARPSSACEMKRQSPPRRTATNNPHVVRLPTRSACSAAAKKCRRSANPLCTSPSATACLKSESSRAALCRSPGTTRFSRGFPGFSVRSRTPSGPLQAGLWFLDPEGRLCLSIGGGDLDTIGAGGGGDLEFTPPALNNRYGVFARLHARLIAALAPWALMCQGRQGAMVNHPMRRNSARARLTLRSSTSKTSATNRLEQDPSVSHLPSFHQTQRIICANMVAISAGRPLAARNRNVRRGIELPSAEMAESHISFTHRVFFPLCGFTLRPTQLRREAGDCEPQAPCVPTSEAPPTLAPIR